MLGSMAAWNMYLKLLIFPVLMSIIYASTEPYIEGDALMQLIVALNQSFDTPLEFSPVSPCQSRLHVRCVEGKIVSLALGSLGFSGTLSLSITKLEFLEYLDLGGNKLSGPLPAYLGNMQKLQILNLADNNFNGSIPASWGQLSSLTNLVMRGNHLTGNIPDSLANITGLVVLDLSSNDLSGRIPVELFSKPSYNFSGTHLTCGSGFQQPCVSSSSNPVSRSNSNVRLSVTSAVCGAFIFLFLGGLFLGAFYIYRFRRARKYKQDIFVDVEGEIDSEISYGQVRRFSLREIQLATDNFGEGNIIGQGGFGKVYKGILTDNTMVAVKRLSDYHSPGGEAAFLREVHLISVAVHRNLLRLIGYCTTSSERILVYPFMQNLSVAYCLRDLKPGQIALDWPTRNRIAVGSAHGLEYLHEHCNPKIIHRDLKAANILLDDDFEPVLGDFGLAKLVDTKLTHITTKVRGTMGHIAPEYLSTGKSSEKTDVFGYGITLLELVTGQRAIDFAHLEEDEDVRLQDHIKKHLRENSIGDIVDRNLKNFDPKEVEIILQVALLCAQSSPEDRPKMSEVVIMLQGVGLAEKWAEWEHLEEVRSQEVSNMFHRVLGADEFDQEAIELSQAR